MSLNYLIPLALYVATAHPAAYKATRGIFGSWVASADGLASTAGVVLHAVVFVLVVGFFMRALNPRKSGYPHTSFGKAHEAHRSAMSDDLEGYDFPAKI